MMGKRLALPNACFAEVGLPYFTLSYVVKTNARWLELFTLFVVVISIFTFYGGMVGGYIERYLFICDILLLYLIYRLNKYYTKI